MGIAKGKESIEAQEFKRYTGIASVTIKAVCPTKKELESLGRNVDEEPVYTGTSTDSNGTEYQTARLQIVFEVDSLEEKPSVTMTMFLENRPRYNSDQTKVQVIDKYGRTAWATIEQAKAKKVPLDRNGRKLNIDSDYRPAYVGEEYLVNFVKAYLCIPSLVTWDANERAWVTDKRVKAEDCECRFDSLGKVFKGDFSEIKDAIGYQPTNKVKVLLGVRSDDSGRMFQTVYNRTFLKNSANSYRAIEREIEDSNTAMKANGRTPNTVYTFGNITEYKVTESVVAQSSDTAPEIQPSDDMPFAF